MGFPEADAVVDAYFIALAERAERADVVFPYFTVPELETVDVGFVERFFAIDCADIEVALFIFFCHTSAVEHEPETERLICVCEVVEREPEVAHGVVVAQKDIPHDDAISIGVFNDMGDESRIENSIESLERHDTVAVTFREVFEAECLEERILGIEFWEWKDVSLELAVEAFEDAAVLAVRYELLEVDACAPRHVERVFDVR